MVQSVKETVISAGASSTVATTAGSLGLTGAAVASLTATTGDCSLAATAGSANVSGGEGVVDAVKIHASDAAGGITLLSGTTGIDADTTGELNLTSSKSSATAVQLLATGANGGVKVQSTKETVISAGASSTIDTTAGSLGLTGAAVASLTATTGDCSLAATAGSANVSGGEGVIDAVKIHASNTAGGITLVSGTTGIDADTTGELNLTSSKSSATAVQLLATGADGGVKVQSTKETVISAGASSTIDTTAGSLGLTGAAVASLTATTGDCSLAATAGSANVSGGEGVVDAVKIHASNTAGRYNDGVRNYRN